MSGLVARAGGFMMSVCLYLSLLWIDCLWQNSWQTPVSVNGALGKLSICCFVVEKRADDGR